ncbi:hypothetical protein ACFE04_016562 [Oxalis oulophora]
MKLLIIFILQISVLLLLTKAKQIPEYKALLSIKSSIIDDPLSSLSSWNDKTHHCTWAHITCDDISNRHIITLDISGLNLTGTLSSDVGHLRFLQNLSVGANQLSGEIPPEISDITGLLSVNFSNNVFNGTLPLEFAKLKELRVLDLYNNNVTGELPLTVTEMPELRHLHLGGNFFSGEIPVEYCKWEFLEYLAVSGNDPFVCLFCGGGGDDDDDNNDDDEDDDEDTGAQIAPIIKLEEVAVSTGEENEDALLDLLTLPRRSIKVRHSLINISVRLIGGGN